MRNPLPHARPPFAATGWNSPLAGRSQTPVQSTASAAEPSASDGAGNRLDQARTVFQEMKQQYAAGNFARYGELLQELGKLLTPP